MKSPGLEGRLSDFAWAGQPLRASASYLPAERAWHTVRAPWMILHTGQVGVVNIIVKAAFMSGVGSDFLRQLRLILLWVPRLFPPSARGTSVGHTVACRKAVHPITPPEEGSLQCTSALCWRLLSFHFRSRPLWPLLLKDVISRKKICRVSATSGSGL